MDAPNGLLLHCRVSMVTQSSSLSSKLNIRKNWRHEFHRILQCRRRPFGPSSLHRQESHPGPIPVTPHIYRVNPPDTKGQFNLAIPANTAGIFMAERPILERQNLPLVPQMKLVSALELLKPQVFMVTNSCPKIVSSFESIVRWSFSLD